MLFLKQPQILPFFCDKSATTNQIDSIKVLNSKFKPDLYNCVKTEKTESMAPPQEPYKRGTIFVGHPQAIDLLAILHKRLDRALFLYIFIRDVRSSSVIASISIVQIRKFDKM